MRQEEDGADGHDGGMPEQKVISFELVPDRRNHAGRHGYLDGDAEEAKDPPHHKTDSRHRLFVGSAHFTAALVQQQQQEEKGLG